MKRNVTSKSSLAIRVCIKLLYAASMCSVLLFLVALVVCLYSFADVLSEPTSCQAVTVSNKTLAGQIDYWANLFSLLLAALAIPLTILSIRYAKRSLDNADEQLRKIADENRRRSEETVLFDDFKDASFRRYLRECHAELFPHSQDVPAPNGFTAQELERVVLVDISGLPVRDVDGLAVFKNLRRLICDETPITELDLSGLRSLEVVRARDCTALKGVLCRGCTMLGELDLEGSPVDDLDCSHTRLLLESLACKETLKSVVCRAVYQRDGSFLSHVDLDLFPNLEFLDCADNDVRAISGVRGSAVRQIVANRNPLLHCSVSSEGGSPGLIKDDFPDTLEFLLPFRGVGLDACQLGKARPLNGSILSEQFEAHLSSLVEESRRERGLGGDTKIRDTLKWSHALVDECGLLEMPISSQVIEHVCALAGELELEYAAALTQAALSSVDSNYHYAAVEIENVVGKKMEKALDSLAPEIDYDDIEWTLYRSRNSLGVSYQRPQSVFPGRDTERAVALCWEAYQYFHAWTTKAVSKYMQLQDVALERERLRTDILRAVSYCGNYSAALYQRGVDLSDEERIDEARECFQSSIAVRVDIERSIIDDVFGKESLLSCRWMTLRADSIWRMSLLYGADSKQRQSDCDKSIELYKEALETYGQLRAKNGDSSDLKIAELRAQYGLARTYSAMGDYKEAYRISEKVYLERSKILGEAHVDTIKARTTMEQALIALENQ